MQRQRNQCFPISISKLKANCSLYINPTQSVKLGQFDPCCAFRYTERKVLDILEEATLLDPRFKKLPTDADQEATNAVYKRIASKCSALHSLQATHTGFSGPDYSGPENPG